MEEIPFSYKTASLPALQLFLGLGDQTGGGVEKISFGYKTTSWPGLQLFLGLRDRKKTRFVTNLQSSAARPLVASQMWLLNRLIVPLHTLQVLRRTERPYDSSCYMTCSDVDFEWLINLHMYEEPLFGDSVWAPVCNLCWFHVLSPLTVRRSPARCVVGFQHLLNIYYSWDAQHPTHFMPWIVKTCKGNGCVTAADSCCQTMTGTCVTLSC